MSTPDTPAPSDFIRRIVAEDLKNNKHGGRVVTRFPPEPNGYLHIGHAKSICLNFGVALEYGGKCNLRFDDTNPEREDPEYVQAIQDDIRWLGFAWAGDPCHASDYQEQLYRFALTAHRGRQGLRGQLVPGGDTPPQGHPDGTGPGQPLPGALGGREPGPVSGA